MAKAKEQVVANLSVDVLTLNGKKVETLTLSKEVFGVEMNSQVMFDAIQVYQSNTRQATAKVKRKFEVAGSGMKPWRQKGTGRARAGRPARASRPARSAAPPPQGTARTSPASTSATHRARTPSGCRYATA